MKYNLSLIEAKDKMKKGVYLLVFKTTWCPDCKMMEMLIDEALPNWKKEGVKDFDILHIDAEKENLFRSEERYKVAKVPAFYVVSDGVEEFLGYEFVELDKIKNSILTKQKGEK